MSTYTFDLKRHPEVTKVMISNPAGLQIEATFASDAGATQRGEVRIEVIADIAIKASTFVLEDALAILDLGTRTAQHISARILHPDNWAEARSSQNEGPAVGKKRR